MKGIFKRSNPSEMHIASVSIKKFKSKELIIQQSFFNINHYKYNQFNSMVQNRKEKKTFKKY